MQGLECTLAAPTFGKQFKAVDDISIPLRIKNTFVWFKMTYARSM